MHKYWIGLYHAICLLGINEVLPNNTLLFAYCAIGMLVCAIILANSFGTIAILVKELSEKTTKFQE
jgi:hypothetical protein